MEKLGACAVTAAVLAAAPSHARTRASDAAALARSESARQASLAAAASAPGVDDRLGRARTRRRSVDMDEMNQLAARNAKLDAGAWHIINGGCPRSRLIRPLVRCRVLLRRSPSALSDSERRKEAAMREAAARASASVDRVDKVRSRRSSLEELEAIQASQREFAIEMGTSMLVSRRDSNTAVAHSTLGCPSPSVQTWSEPGSAVRRAWLRAVWAAGSRSVTAAL